MQKTPIDIHSIKKYGVSKWIKEYDGWFINDDEFLSFSNDIYKLYIGYVKKEKDLILKESLLVSFKLTLEYEVFLCSYLTFNILRKKNIKPIIDHNSIYYNDFVNKRFPKKGLINKYKSRLYPIKNNLIQQKKGYLKTVFNAIKDYNSKTTSSLNYFFQSSYISFYGNVSNDLSQYSKKNLKNIKYIYPNFNYKINHNSDILNLSQRIIRDLNNIAIKNGSNIDDLYKQYLIDITYEFLNTVYNSIVHFKNYFHNKKYIGFLNSYLGNTSYRCLNSALRLNNIETIGATHGNYVGIHKYKNTALLELSAVDKFLVPTKNSVKLYKKIKKKYINTNVNDNLKIESSDSEYYKLLYSKNKKRQKTNKINSMMVIECPLSEIRYNIYSFWPYQFHMMAQIGIFLKSINLKSIIKVHPDRLMESKNLYDNFYDKIIADPYEEVFDIADSIFFTNLTSTTFGFTLTTQKPIFIFKNMLDDIWKEPKNLIEKRCNVINSNFNSKGVLTFDRKDFNQKIKFFKNINNEFLEKYMIP